MSCDFVEPVDPWSQLPRRPRPWFAASTSTVGSHAGGHWFVVPWQGLQLGLHDLGLLKVIFYFPNGKSSIWGIYREYIHFLYFFGTS